MNCYNGEKYLREAIDSVYAQSFTDWEIILWDDASKDGTESIARSYDEKLRYFKGSKAVSLGQARNWAIEKAKGEFIAFLDQDDIWLPQKLEQQITLFQTDPEIGIVISDGYSFNDNKAIVNQFHPKKKPPTGFVFSELIRRYFIPMPAAIIRRKAFDGLSYGFDERFTQLEETDLFDRIAYTWKLGYVDKCLVKWRMHKESWTFSQPSSYPQEMRLMLDNYAKIFDDFNSRYAKEVRYANAMIDVFLSMNDLNNGRNAEARKRLFPHFKHGYKFIFLYLLCFLPPRIYRLTQRLRGQSPP